MDRGITTNHEKRTTKNGLTLLELLITIAISSLLGATTVLMLRSSLDAYLYGEEQALINKILDDTLEEISGESFKNYGIKDALQILEARQDAIIFIPLWIDDSHRITTRNQRLILNRPFDSGSAIPTLEFRTKDREIFEPAPITFIPRQGTIGALQKDVVIPKASLATGSQVNIIFQPDSRISSDVIMRLNWDSQTGQFLRTYKNKTERIPKGQYKGIRLTQARFQYFDNSNTEIVPPVPEQLLSAISAVKISLTLESTAQIKKRQAFTFINLRNSRTFGKGITVRKGMQMKIPDSRGIRTLALGNILGIKEGDIIQLKAQPQQGKAWRITVEFGIKNELPIIKKYTIEYPPGFAVYSEKIDASTDAPFNLLNIGKNGRYDYDFDDGIENAVDLKGEVNLFVEEMTAQGAAIFVRP
jgi:prepilin-type N-terminal cleavage/methylation domain-containing protein